MCRARRRRRIHHFACDTMLSDLKHKMTMGRVVPRDKVYLKINQIGPVRVVGEKQDIFETNDIGIHKTFEEVTISHTSLTSNAVKRITLLPFLKLTLNNIEISENDLKILLSTVCTYGFSIGSIKCDTAWKVIKNCLKDGFKIFLHSSFNVRAFKPLPYSNFTRLVLDEAKFGIIFTPIFMTKLLIALNYIQTFGNFTLKSISGSGTLIHNEIEQSIDPSNETETIELSPCCLFDFLRGKSTVFLNKGMYNFSIAMDLYQPLKYYPKIIGFLHRYEYDVELRIRSAEVYSNNQPGLKFCHKLDLITISK